MTAAATPAALYQQAVVLGRQGLKGQYAEALARVLAVDPDYPPALHDQAVLAKQAGRLEQAEQLARRALALNSGSWLCHYTLGNILSAQGRPRDAAQCFQQATARAPSRPDIKWSLARELLLLGHLDQGWHYFEARHDALGLRQPPHATRWDGRRVSDFTLLVLDEQGFGDSIQFARFLTMIPRGPGGRVVFYGKPRLLPLLDGLPGVDEVGDWGQLPAFDAWVPLLSLPAALGYRSLDRIPPPGGWLRPEPRRVADWRPRIRGTDDRPVVGLCWRGNGDFPQDDIRSPGLASLRPLLDVAGLRFVALQVGVGRREIAELGLENRLDDIGGIIEAQGSDFRDTAAVMQSCDLVMSSCTSVVHVAGSLNRPTWLLLSALPDWRWLLERRDSPWYPSLRLFRQPRPGDWDGVARAVAEELATIPGRRQNQTVMDPAR